MKSDGANKRSRTGRDEIGMLQTITVSHMSGLLEVEVQIANSPTVFQGCHCY